MAKKELHPLEEGDIATIDKMFFRPLLSFKSEEQNLTEWYEFLFGIKTREVTPYLAKKPFTMPGLLLAAANVKIQGIGHREMKRNTQIWVRENLDPKEPITVEVLAGRGRKDQSFELTRSEWNFVKLHLRDWTHV